MNSIRERIAIALKRSDKSQRDLAKHMNVSSSAVNRMLGDGIGREIDSIKYILAVQDLTGYRFEWLRTGTGPEVVDAADTPDVQSLEFLKGILKSKDDLIKEQAGRIGDLQRLNSILESQNDQLKNELGVLKGSASKAEPKRKNRIRSNAVAGAPGRKRKKKMR